MYQHVRECVLMSGSVREIDRRVTETQFFIQSVVNSPFLPSDANNNAM